MASAAAAVGGNEALAVQWCDGRGKGGVRTGHSEPRRPRTLQVQDAGPTAEVHRLAAVAGEGGLVLGWEAGRRQAEGAAGGGSAAEETPAPWQDCSSHSLPRDW
jgi:hypothetical protein